MFLLMISVLFLTGGVRSQIGENENCDTAELKLCVKSVPKTRVGLPRNKAELDAHCLAYQTGMSCMDAWMHRCLPTDGQKIIQKQIGGARALMRFLCANDTALKREYLKEQSCWARVSPHWLACLDELQVAVKDITEQSPHLAYFYQNSQYCCAREEFLDCVSDVGRLCSVSAGTLLQRMAWVLAQDISTCSPPQAHCNAPDTIKLTATLLAMLPVVQYL